MRHVINEWWLNDASGENGLRNQKAASSLIDCITVSDLRLIIVKNSRWMNKLFKLCKSNDIAVNKLAGQLVTLVRNQSKCDLLEEHPNYTIPEEYVSVKDDDHFLIEAFLRGNADVLITTDHPLMDILKKIPGQPIKCQHRDDFLISIKA